MVTPSQVAEMIKAGLPDAKIQVEDLTGGGDHYQARVVSAAFEGKSRVQQHQLVYGALKQAMASEAIHALGLETLTPAEWEAKSQVA
ncbi:BolA family transcriptional regulator [Microcoleus sp. AT3-A2]|jgi:acid stress-induced BolA-like protein IbaG/YrbA|uniref:BolA family transcriptional regulator n=1 Tax=Microcoleus TaxID=44471 RepID=UPI0022C90911|nr:BolA family transcriptional regulator [Microcoleus sp. HI-ES]MCZ0903055.1 BolA family transcriptional regulator [Microcoleus sp. HI-ES]